ncbi:glycosyltransferase [Aquabacter spiritensis]|uniref:Glycosyltransferase involved in cell wall biosynthesis n=1 Tax=Aquabacter spiritensis TaxID=933073 RepID=A0A4R3M0R0_9HYPH|nr:glycosyltransferase [Aquabacter spiritensis]TCT06572.1 glycosyltransferase involved in cell wall biosynthesis [Aquabacter spiritensis]
MTEETGGVVQIVQRIIPGGIETLALELAARLPGENQVLSLEWSNARIVDNWPAMAARSHTFSGLEKPPGLRPDFILALARRLKALAPRAVMAHHIGPLFYGGLAARLAGISRFVYVEHDVWHYENSVDRRLARIASLIARPRIVAVSASVARTVERFMPRCPITVIPNAVDTDRFVPSDRQAARDRLGLSRTSRIIGAAGRLEPVKGQDVLVAAMAQIPDTALVLVGDGSAADALKAQVAALGLSERVHFLGHRNDLPEIYPAFDLVCLPSRNEGLPLSVLEAQACGIPVVATDVGSVREGICPGTGALVPPDDPDTLAAELRAKLAAPATGSPRAFVLQHFSWRRMIAAYETLLGLHRP